MPRTLESFLRPPVILRAVFTAAVCGGLLFAFALPSSPALSADNPSEVTGGAVARLAPPLVPTTAVATPAALDKCADILRGDAPMGGRAVPAHYRDNLMPMAIIGMMTGVNHVTGPRERTHAFMPENTAASLDGRNARAIAAYRHCRAEAHLRTLSN